MSESNNGIGMIRNTQFDMKKGSRKDKSKSLISEKGMVSYSICANVFIDEIMCHFAHVIATREVNITSLT